MSVKTYAELQNINRQRRDLGEGGFIDGQDLMDNYDTGAAHAAMNFNSGTTATAVGSVANIDLADMANLAGNLSVVPDQANDKFTIAKAGLYRITIALQVLLSANATTYTLRARTGATPGSGIIAGSTWTRLTAAGSEINQFNRDVIVNIAADATDVYLDGVASGAGNVTLQGGSILIQRVK